METKTTIQTVYSKAFDVKPDNKITTYWVNAIQNGEKTIDDYTQFIKNSNDYKSRVMSKCKSLWCEIIGTEFDSNVVLDFLEQSSIVIGSEDIRMFLKNTNIYKEKIRCVVMYVFQSRFNKEPSEEDILYYIGKFQNNDNYSISSLESDIKYWNKDVICDFCSQKNISDSSKVYEEYVKLKSDDMYMLEFITKPHLESECTAIALDNDFITRFETVFGRPMYIQEYSKYFDARKSMCISSLHAEHNKQYAAMKDVHKKYIAYDLKEYEYIQMFLFSIGTPNFVEEFSNNIVFNEKYIAKMKDNIINMYKNVYDEQLESVDVDYVFDKVQKQQLHLDDPRLDEILLDFKQETDDIVTRIFKLYMEIYERTPDKSELVEKAFCYRRKDSFDGVDRVIEKELMACLEFHDIIKKKIRKLKPDVNVSDVYKMLSIVITKLDTLRITGIDEFIIDL